jgi:DNA polymerase
MSAAYQKLVDAAIQHLQELKERGVRYVAVSSGTLTALAGPAGESDNLAPGDLQPPCACGPATAPGIPAAIPAARAGLPSVFSARAVQEPDAAQAAVTTAKSALGDREMAMAELRERAMVCRKCAHLAASRKNVVFGVGDIYSPLLFVGEAPGADEDRAGEPFVGKAGQLLTRIIQTMGFTRNSVYIANILKCRPDTPHQTAGNRKPTAEEMKTCLPYLLAQIDVIQPQVIVALGGTAVEGLLGLPGGITKLRGRWQEFRGVPVMPTYHPAYLLRNEALSEKRKVWEDMLQVLEKLGQTISEKQRNYFLTR